MKYPEKLQTKRKANSRKRPEKPVKKNREAERMMKKKSLADFIDRKVEEAEESEHPTFAQDQVVCPFCGWQHEPEELSIKKQHDGLAKCSECGEAFEYEVVVRKAYTTFVP